MKIGIFLHPYSEAKPAGLGRYILELTRSLISAKTEHTFVIFLKRQPFVFPIPESSRVSYVCGAEGIFWQNKLIKKGPKCDVYLFNTPIVPFGKPRGVYVPIVLDFAYLNFPADSVLGKIKEKLLSYFHKRTIQKARHVIAISEATKLDTVRRINISPEKITVIYPGFDHFFITPQETETPAKFFLSVGVIKKRKNLLTTLRAFKKFREAGGVESFLVAGKGDDKYARDVRVYAERECPKGSVLFLDFVSDAVLQGLYKKATALVFPSLEEGFGFPVLEAFASGCPVITSNKSSLPEVAGDGAVLVSPTDEGDIRDAMIKISRDVEFRERLRTIGYREMMRFSWEKTAEETLSLLALLEKSAHLGIRFPSENDIKK